MAGPARPGLRAVPPAGGGFPSGFPLPFAGLPLLIPGDAKGRVDVLKQAPAAHHEGARRHGRWPVRVPGRGPEEAGALFEESFESREPGLCESVLGAEEEELRQGCKEKSEEHRAPQRERAVLRTGDRQSLAAVR